MSEFTVYARLGFDHISDIQGYDHILFLLAMCAAYSLLQWRQVLWLVTAFTIGHSVTLALATLKVVPQNAALIEFLIPLTIFWAATANLTYSTDSQKGSSRQYLITFIFGLIHGLGFSNFLQQLLGSEANLLLPLLAFNIGLELGQILIVLIILTISYLLHKYLKLKLQHWKLALSVVAIIWSVYLMIDRWPW